METFKLAKRDIVLGVRKKMRYPVFVIVCLIGCMNFSGLMEDGLELFGKSNPSMANCFAFIFQKHTRRQGYCRTNPTPDRT